MKNWLIANVAIPAAMVAATAVFAGIYVSTEIDSYAYGTLTNMYRQGADAYRSQIEALAAQGPISQWTYTGLVRDYWLETHILNAPNMEAAPDERGRSFFLKNVNAHSRDSN